MTRSGVEPMRQFRWSAFRDIERCAPGKRSRIDICRISFSENRCPLFREML